MAKTRLTNDFRDEIRLAALHDTIHKRWRSWEERNHDLLRRVGIALYGADDYAALERVAEKQGGGMGPVDLTTYQSLAVNGYQRPFRMRKAVIELPLHAHAKIKDKKLQKELEDAADEERTLGQANTVAHNQLQELLKAHKTFEDLLENWPDGKAYIEPAYQRAKADRPALPMVKVGDLNKALGLPKESEAA
jgi:flagellar motility protein MotE (MotC chaperone)